MVLFITGKCNRGKTPNNSFRIVFILCMKGKQKYQYMGELINEDIGKISYM
jgi:hypothetical protein